MCKIGNNDINGHLFRLRSLINEGFNDADTSGWVCIGEVNGAQFPYIMVNPVKKMKWGEEIHEVRYCQNRDGSGGQTESLMPCDRDKVEIYPEYYDSELSEKFLGKKKSDDEIERIHSEFMSKVFVLGDKVVLHHNSSYRITDGVVKQGKPNGYSKNSDVGIYFWASKHSGKDPSNSSLYTYYCLIDVDDLYDFEANVDRTRLVPAMKRHGYVGQLWPMDKSAVVVNTFKETPIWRILDKQTGRWYDAGWNEVEKPF